MGTEIGKRLRWVQLVEQGKNCTQVCLQCGISRPTLRKWVERYRAAGPDGLVSKSRRPHRSPASKVSEQERAWVTELRKRGLGSRRIQSQLKRNYDLELSRPTIEKVFQSLEPRPRLVRTFTGKGRKRYARKSLVSGCKWTPARLRPASINTRRSMTAPGFVCWHCTNAEARPIRCSSSKRLSRNFPFRSNEYKPIAVENSLPMRS